MIPSARVRVRDKGRPILGVDWKRLWDKAKKEGITRNEISRRMNVTPYTLREYYKDPRRIPYEVIVNLANIVFEDTREAQDVLFGEKGGRTRK